MGMLRDFSRRRKNIFAGNIPPLERRFLALLELIFITYHDLRQMRDRQTNIYPRAADIQMQIAIQAKGGWRIRPVKPPGIGIIFTALLETAADESELILPQLQPELEIFPW